MRSLFERRPRFWALVLTGLMLLSGTWIPVGSESAEGEITSVADYGIFDRISSLNAEMNTRMDDPEVLEMAGEAFSGMRSEVHEFEEMDTGAFREKEFSVPPPITESPVIFDALSGNPIVNNTNILDWVLPPPISDEGAVNYLILSHHPNGDSWYLGSMIPRIGLFLDSSLDKWVPVDVDGDSEPDIRARMTFARDILERDWETTLFPPSITFRDSGLKLEIQPVGDKSTGGALYFIKAISYGGKNYIWSVGFDLERYVRMEVRVQAREWKVRPTGPLLSNFNLRDLGLLEILGPYTLSYSFDPSPEKADILVSVMRILERELQDRAFVKLRMERDPFHDGIIPEGRLVLKVASTDSPIEGLSWRAGSMDPPDINDTMSLGIEYAEFGTDLVHAMIDIPIMPGSVDLDITTYQENGWNVSRLEITSPNGIQTVHFLEVSYPRWEDGVTADGWTATDVMIQGIPRDLVVITTSVASFDIDQGNSTLQTALLDSLMNQVAGRFYRIGKILREIPTTILELPSRKGWSEIDCMGSNIYSVEFLYTKGPFLASTGDHLAFLISPDGSSSISGHISGLASYSARFLPEGNEMALSLSDPGTLDIFSMDDLRSALVHIRGVPAEITLRTDDDSIEISGQGGIGGVSYIYRETDLNLDVDIGSIPDTLRIVRGVSRVSLECPGGSIGYIELFASSSGSLLPVVLGDDNYLSAIITDGNVAFGARLRSLSGIVYDNSTEGFIEISSASSTNMLVHIDDRDVGMFIRAALVPLPRSFHLDFPEVIERPRFDFPDMRAIANVVGYAQIILSLGSLAQAMIEVSSGISVGLTNAIGQYSSGLDLSWDLTVEKGHMDLFLEIDKRGTSPTEEAHWTHGVWMEQNGMGLDSSVNGRIFLGGMPTKGNVSLSFSEEIIEVDIDFKGYRPTFEWLLIRTNGVQDRDISLYVKGLEQDIDLRMATNITTDLSIGGEMVILMDALITTVEGDPVNLGEIVATLTKARPILSVRQMYLPELPSRFVLEAYIQDGVRAKYEASSRIEYLYFKLTKLLDGRWSHVYAIFHDLPLWFDVELVPSKEFSIREPFPLQGLPVMNIGTSDADMDIFIEYDGTGFGQRGRFQITARDVGNTSTYYDGGDYVMDSDGIGFISVDIGTLPVMEAFTLEALTLLGIEVEHFRISVDMVFGLYPIITISESDGEALQLKLYGSVELRSKNYEPNIFFSSIKVNRVLGIPFVTGVAISRDTAAVDMDTGDGSVVLPAPVLTGWYYLFKEVVG